MKRLADGIYALLHGAGRPSALEHLAHGELRSVDGADAAELARLAHGVPDDEPDSALFVELMGAELAGRGLSSVDAAVHARLAFLGEGFRWSLSRDPDDDGARLAELLRRAHARRKVFVQEFGQTPCLPESAARRCLVVKARVPRGGRVLLLGDDDLVGLGLAALGYEVVSADIDPLLIAFLERAAREEGLPLCARVLDLLAPLADDDVGSFDAVLTDPMSFERCMLAFVSRALALVREGGLVFTCVNPVARAVFRERVLPRLPARVGGVCSLLNAYYYDRYVENAYRSDLVVLERTAGALAFAPSEPIPFEAITEGRLREREHLHVVAKGMRGRAKGALGGEALAAALGGAEVLASYTSADGRYAHAAVLTRERELVAAVFDGARSTLALSSYPGVRERVLAACDTPSVMRTLKRDGWVVASLRV